MALPIRDQRPSAAAKTAMNAAFPHLNLYFNGTPAAPGILKRYMATTNSRRAELLANNPIFANFTQILRDAGVNI